MASILVVSGPSEGDYYLLGKETTLIGRDDHCPIQIVDDRVSRKHIEFARGRTDRDYLVTDLGSANGTFVNDSRIAEGAPLKDGDIIRIGGTEIMFMAVDFADGETAFQHYRQRGEHRKSTIYEQRSAISDQPSAE